MFDCWQWMLGQLIIAAIALWLAYRNDELKEQLSIQAFENANLKRVLNVVSSNRVNYDASNGA